LIRDQSAGLVHDINDFKTRCITRVLHTSKMTDSRRNDPELRSNCKSGSLPTAPRDAYTRDWWQQLVGGAEAGSVQSGDSVK
jgi:hypothetical protein